MDRDAVNEALERFQADGDFERDWQRALQAAPRRPTSGMAIATGLAAAAVLGWVGWTALAPLLAETGAPETAAASGRRAADDGVIRMGAGHAALWHPDRPVKSASIVLPDHVDVLALPDGGFQLNGLRPGTTDLVVAYAEGEPEVLHLEVTFEAESPQSTAMLEVGLGTFRLFDVSGVESVSVVDPDVVEVVNVGGRAAFRGLRPGQTDVVLVRGGKPTVWTLTLGDAPGPDRVQDRTLRIGGADLLRLDAKAISVADPDILTVQAVQDGVVSVMGIRPGRSDVLVATEDGGLEHFRFAVGD
ncbi:MAG: pilus assembly protein N-terminal domain-containing protein [Alphaproteobacteria bacterium]|nr:pilus assembly protein N-terminal domain-containing protein [Alphaproteobacteria bacterium]